MGTLNCGDLDALAGLVAEQVTRHRAEMIVLGLPLNMDGSCGESGERAKAFAQVLQQRCGVAVDLWDERLTTKAAAGFLNVTDTRGKKRKAVIDTVSAVLILEGYLAWRAAHPGQRYQREESV